LARAGGQSDQRAQQEQSRHDWRDGDEESD
jgi:hypothetical protein